MKTASRILLAIVVAFTVSFFYNLLLGVHIRILLPVGFKDMGGMVLSLLLIAGTGWLVWHLTSPTNEKIGSPARHAATGALLIGALGFTAGFVGPILLGWGGNLGPMLGILVTGPGGLVVGAILGYVYWIRARDQTR